MNRQRIKTSQGDAEVIVNVTRGELLNRLHANLNDLSTRFPGLMIYGKTLIAMSVRGTDRANPIIYVSDIALIAGKAKLSNPRKYTNMVSARNDMWNTTHGR